MLHRVPTFQRIAVLSKRPKLFINSSIPFTDDLNIHASGIRHYVELYIDHISEELACIHPQNSPNPLLGLP